MRNIHRQALDPDSLLFAYTGDDNYTDCYVTQIAGAVTLEQFINAFYTTWLFRVERVLLKWGVKRPSTDRDVRQLARGEADTFAAWHVERRRDHEILLCDLNGATRSWLKVATDDTGMTTVLHFGSAVVAGEDGMSRAFNALLGFHKLYSRALLALARRRLKRRRHDATRE